MKGISRRVVALMLIVLMAAMLWCGCANETVNNDTDDAAPTSAVTASTTMSGTTTTQKAVIDDLSSINLRSGPGTEYESVATIQEGEEFIILGREGDWFKVDYRGTIGYVSAQYVNVEGQPNISEMEAERITVTTTGIGAGADGTTVSGGTTTTTDGFLIAPIPGDHTVG